MNYRMQLKHFYFWLDYYKVVMKDFLNEIFKRLGAGVL